MKDITGYEGMYAATKDGRIWSYPKKWARTGHNGKFLKNWLIGHGYEVVMLYPEPKKGKKFLVHRLVAMTYIPNPDGLPEVNHKDGNRRNNRLENLEWCTSTINKRHAWDMGLYKHSKLNEEQVREIRKLYATGNYTQKAIGDMFGISKGHICWIVKRGSWSHID